MPLDDIAKSGFVRMSELMNNMLNAATYQDKQKLIAISETFIEDSSDFIAVLYTLAGIEDGDMERYAASNQTDEQLIRMAKSDDVRSLRAQVDEQIRKERELDKSSPKS